MTIVDNAARAEFREQGVTCFRQAVPLDQSTIMREAFDWSVAHPGRMMKPVQPGTPGTLWGDLANPDSFPAYHDVNFKTVIPQLVSELWQKPDVWFMYEQVFIKTGGDSGSADRTPWHQDISYLPVSGEDLAVVWISFESLTMDESPEFVAGSHRGVMYDGSSFDPQDHTAPLYGDGSLPRLPDIEADRSAYSIISYAIEPGDIVVFHPGMLHGGAPTAAGCQRNTLSLRYFGEDAVVSLRPNDTEDMLTRIANKESGIHPMQKAKLLGEGADFRDWGFPKVYPRG